MRRSLIAGLDSVAQLAELNPHAPALLEPGGRTLDYGELWKIIAAVRVKLQDAGISPDDIAAVLAPPGNLQIFAVAGVLSHCICAPLQPRTIVSEVESSLRKLGASALIVSPEFAAEASTASAMGLTIVTATATQSPRDWQIQRAAVPAASRSLDPEVALLLMTSATTGAPKIVPLTVANLNTRLAARRNTLTLGASDRQLLMTSLSHVIGLENTLAQFLAGGSVIAAGGFDPNLYLDWLRNLRPTWYDCAPTVHQAALAQLRLAPGEQFSLRFVQSAGAPLPREAKETLEEILGVPVLNDYGMTEACPIAVDVGKRIPHSAGRSCGLEIAIMGSSHEFLPFDRDGEIVVRGPALFSGYLDEPEANAALFHDDWFRTGDAGHLDAAGNLYIIGRIKEMINRGGEKIAPGEVDAVIASHPAVLEAAAFAVPHPTLGEDVACAVVLRVPSEQEVMARELRRLAVQRLASYKVPRRICFVPQIPRGELGKPQRWLIPELVNSKRAAPRPGEVTQRIAEDDDGVFYRLYEIWARVLDREDLGFDEDFFEAGGDSLGAVNMLAEVDLRFGCDTKATAATFLDEPTLDRLAALVRTKPVPVPTRNGSSEMKIFPVRETGSARRLFCFPADGEEGLYFRRLATHLRGQIDLYIMRPGNALFDHGLFSFERAGEAAAALIRQAQPADTCLVGGFCYGGIVAFEAARQLLLAGRDVRLAFFDVPMPGYPPLLFDWRSRLRMAVQRWNSRQPDGDQTIGRSTRYLGRRAVWTAAHRVRRFLVPFGDSTPLKQFLAWAQYNYFPLYNPRPIDASILHFLCSETSYRMQGLSRFGWRKMARGGVEERFVPFDHANIFHESNLPLIVDELRRWR